MTVVVEEVRVVEVRVVVEVVVVRVATVEVRAVAMAAAVTVQVIVAVVRAVVAMAEEADLGRLLGHLAPVVLVHDGVPVGRQDEELGDHPSPAALSLRAPAAQERHGGGAFLTTLAARGDMQVTSAPN